MVLVYHIWKTHCKHISLYLCNTFLYAETWRQHNRSHDHSSTHYLETQC